MNSSLSTANTSLNLNQHFYINLDSCKTRRLETITELKKIGIKKPNRFEAVKDEIGLVGCAKSHIAVLEKAKELDWDYCIVFEDDIVIEGKKALLEKMKKYICYDFDVLFLGCWNVEPPITIEKDLLKITKAWTTHAYICKKHYYDILIENYREGMNEKINKDNPSNNIDEYISILQKRDKWYCLNPIHITQKDGWSYNFNEVRNLQQTIKKIPT